MAVNGKSVRGARTTDDRDPHLLAASITDGIALGLVNVGCEDQHDPHSALSDHSRMATASGIETSAARSEPIFNSAYNPGR